MISYNRSAGDEVAQLRLSSLAIAAAISLGDYPAYTEIERQLKYYATAEVDRKISICAEISLATAAVSAIAPNMVPTLLKKGDLNALPPWLRANALYLQLICATACYASEQTQEAEDWLIGAMQIHLPHGFITPFAELIKNIPRKSTEKRTRNPIKTRYDNASTKKTGRPQKVTTTKNNPKIKSPVTKTNGKINLYGKKT